MSSIDDLIDAVEQDKKNQLGLSLSEGAKKSPEKSAQIYQLSKEKQLPYDYVERNVETVSKPNPQNLPPGLQRFFSNRRHAEIAHDDVENLSWWETTIQEGKNVGKLFPSAAKSVSSAGYSVLSSGFDLLSILGTRPLSKLGLMPDDAAKTAADYLRNIATVERQAAEGYLPEKSVFPDPVIGGIKSAILNIPALGAAAVTRNPNVALGAMGAVTYGDSYLRGKEAGLDTLSSTVYAVNDALAEMATEKIPAFRLIEDLGVGSSFSKTLLRQMAAEIPGEQIATVWQDMNAWAALNPDKTLKEFMAERPDAAVDTLISTMVATGLQTSVISGLDRLTRGQEQKLLTDIGAQTKASKLATRAPDLFQQHIQDLVDDYGVVDTVYIDASQARTLFQDLKDDDAKSLLEDQIEEAESVGGDIVVPMGEFAAKVATSENYEALKPIIRLSPDNTQTDEQALNQVSALVAEAQKSVELKTRADEIYKEIETQLLATGRITPEIAKHSAALVPAYVTTKASRLGLSVDEVYQQMGLKVVGPDVEIKQKEGARVLEQAKETGYQGEDVVEANEWQQAFEKFGAEGMTEEARMARAQQMGFDTSEIWLHGSPEENLNEIAIGYDEPGAWFTKRPNYASQYGDNIYSVYVNHGKQLIVTFQEDEEFNLIPVIDNKRFNELTTNVEIAQYAENNNYDSLYFPDGNYTEDDETLVIFNHSSIRSEDAAFDPDFKDSPKLLAQSSKNEDTDSSERVKLPNPIYFGDKSRISGFTNKNKTVLYGYDKNGEIFTIEPKYIDLDDITKGTENSINQIRIAKNKILEQEGEETARGQISLLPGESIIRLSEASDPTTFLHELGHLFLEMEGRFPATKDTEILLKWLGVKSFGDIKTEHHEKFARGFEKYLGEGKAPSLGLQGAFRRFSAWIKQVYRNLLALDVNLNDNIRGVMDRMLATDDEINRVKNHFQPLFNSAEDAGMSEAEYRKYTEMSPLDAAKEALQTKLIKQLRRQTTQWWRQEYKVLEKEIREKLLEDPLYSAVNYIKSGTPLEGFETTKLSRQAVLDELDHIPQNLRGMTADGGVNPDSLASTFGFSSGQELIHLIAESPTLKAETKQRTQDAMIQRHGDILHDGSIEREAQAAMASFERAKKLSAELSALARKTKRPSIDRAALKEYALEKINNTPYNRLRPGQYRAAEVRAARKAAELKAKKDFAGAQQAKIQELIHFYLSREATKALNRADRIRTAHKAIQTKKYNPSRIDTDYVNQAKVLIAAYDFRKSSTDSTELAQARLNSVKHWIEAQQENPDNVATFVQAEILGKLIPMNDMTIGDINGLNDVVQSIMHAAKLRAEEDKAEYRRNIDIGKQSIIDNRIDEYKTEIDTNLPWVKVKNIFDQATASMRKMESLARQADGMNEQGWVWKNTIKPLLDAANEQLRRRQQSGDELKALFQGFNGAFSSIKDIRTFTLESGKKFRLSYGGRLSLALNLGNDGNREALKSMKTVPLTDNDINQIVSTLSDRDWQLVQDIWDYIDKFFPEIAKLEKARSGVAPEKVQPRAFKTPSGIDMKGGYYPLAGDPSADTKQMEQDIDTQANTMMNGGHAAKSTKHGSTIERTGFGGKKIDFSVNVLFNHIDGVIHDITHWSAVRNVDRVLKNEKIHGELATSLTPAGVQAMKQRLKEIAAGPQRIEGLGWINRILRHARLASTYSALGYSLRTALVNTMGLTTAIADMDTKSIAAGTIEFWSNPKQMSDLILSKSIYMTERGQVLNRDIAYIRANLKGDNFFTKFKDYSFGPMTMTDIAITRPIWLAAYRQGEKMFHVEQDAIDYADRMVARTQGSGMDLDLANVETRSELMRTMTVMYTAFSAMYNIMAEQIKRQKAGKINKLQLAAKLSWLIIVPGIISALFTQSDEDDETKEKLAHVGWEIAGQGLGMIPIARDAMSYARYGSSFPTPLLRLGIAPIKAAQQLYQGEVDKGLVGSLTELASWAHVPGGAQFTRTYGYLADLQDGEVDSFSPYELLITGKE